MKTFTYSIKRYKKIFENMNLDETLYLEKMSFKRIELKDYQFLLNEKIKISNTFSRYFIEKCNFKEMMYLRNIIEDYEEKVEELSFEYYNFNEYKNLVYMTVVLDLMIGVDVSYYSYLYDLFERNIVDEINLNIKSNAKEFLNFKYINSLFEERTLQY